MEAPHHPWKCQAASNVYTMPFIVSCKLLQGSERIPAGSHATHQGRDEKTNGCKMLEVSEMRSAKCYRAISGSSPSADGVAGAGSTEQGGGAGPWSLIRAQRHPANNLCGC